MSYEKVKVAKAMAIGTKQTKKAIENLSAVEVILADDADQKIQLLIFSMCQARGIPVVRVLSMRELGKACGIDVGAATVAICK
ncbi:ribosomal L7Ae/L30e/S12e/Gadd45 family protein [Thermoactinomyces sp. DSM 45892]|uniref:ribosomal L7Ae/L30e/S12e/Gadd45 family protein n=1 Tax=Thermoactinomyces sp. DSM 45892 TaxID=1882753 RepID=UPI000894EB73|nr:ribosomal L7Ae/L30e/S12e/Gadd45 family protein [Thermoactinomyces sp. DSM 45892]SDY93283.1 LSU ribosomal protein L7AE [Thermoactinomyces sp. DSM 45892]